MKFTDVIRRVNHWDPVSPNSLTMKLVPFALVVMGSSLIRPNLLLGLCGPLVLFLFFSKSQSFIASSSTILLASGPPQWWSTPSSMFFQPKTVEHSDQAYSPILQVASFMGSYEPWACKDIFYSDIFSFLFFS